MALRICKPIRAAARGRFACALAVSASFVALAQTTNPFANDPKAASAGALIYRVHCASCHGREAQGGHAPDLARGSFRAGEQDADLFGTVSEGISGTEMTSFKRLGAENIWRVIAYLRSTSMGDAAAPGNAARGETLFWGRGGCGNCHTVGDRGNRMGPDLSRIGRQRSVTYLRESLVSPGADIVPGYGGVTVVLRDGKTVRGIQKKLDDFSVVLVDFSGKVYSFERNDVRSAESDTQSLMPEYGKTLSAAELDDVVSYLLTLGRSEVKP